MSWHLRYAPHLGYRPPFEPMFRALVGSDDPVEHVAFAADQGFAGVLCAAVRRLDAGEQARVGHALAQRGLQAGCVLTTTFDQLKNTSWATDSDDARRWITTELEQAKAAAQRVGARQLAVLGGADPDRPIGPQREAFVRNLRHAADLAARDGLVLCLETLNAHTVPGMLLHHLPDALAVLRAVDHPAVRLIFDTAHVQAMDGDLLAQLDAAWKHIEIVQLADCPGRLEPGTGQVDFAGVLQTLARRGYQGLVELEHGWAQPGADSERRGLDSLRRLDEAAASPA
ncbi:TIM barrel protein [Hydrogenophaga sp. BPS33]|uniref:TIM barrel protein n=1 Tax=Hydrogenophaga sp. BPS33 TaxID=2651974 RepID=UPI0013202F01|nr:TIM barrel protein [Hydrogenophaga sp. BPS33]QHE83484.1 TIM barrel protein [Hydrogenophaga sp. BPS33]